MKTWQQPFIEWWNLHAMMAPWLLLGLLVAGSLGMFFSKTWLNRHLGSSGFGAILKASVLGIPLPLCSCSVIPMGVGLYRKGASRASSMAFLTSTPQTGVDSIFLTAGVLGWPLVVIKVLTALLMGLIVGALNMKSDDGGIRPSEESGSEKESKGFRGWCYDSLVDLPAALAKPYLIGVSLSVILTLILPDDALARWAGPGLMGMVLALLISLPTYVCATASVPLALLFMEQGMGLGGVLVFLLAGPASNGATMMVIARTFGWKSFVKYFLTIVACSFLAGYLLEGWLPEGSDLVAPHHHEHLGLLENLSGVMLLLLLLKPLIPKFTKVKGETLNLELEGLSCMGCVQKLTKAFEERKVGFYSIDTSHVRVEASMEKEAKLAIQDMGFRVKENQD